VIFVGMCQRQMTDFLYYVCVRYLRVLGTPVPPACIVNATRSLATSTIDGFNPKMLHLPEDIRQLSQRQSSVASVDTNESQMHVNE